jgi:hypothetical protein
MTVAFVALLTLAFVAAGCVTSNTSPSPAANTSMLNTSAPTTAVSREMVTYQNTSWGFKLSYPEGWYVDAPGNASKPGIYFVTQPLENTSGWKMIVYKIDKPPYESSNNTDAALNKVNQFISNQKNSTAFNDYKVVQGPTRVTLGGVPAWQYTASYSLTGAESATFIWATHGNYLYGIIYSGPLEEYDRYLGAAQQIIDSFEFI